MHTPCAVPDGFYLVADSASRNAAFCASVVDAVRKVTHVARADAQGCLCGEPAVQEGVVEVPAKQLGLCAGAATPAAFACTTEVYPDSPQPGVTAAQCNAAQAAAVVGALAFLAAHHEGALRAAA